MTKARRASLDEESDNACTSMTKTRKASLDEESDNCILKRFKRTPKEEPNVLVRVGSQDFNVRLILLLKESLYFLRRVDSMFRSHTASQLNSVLPQAGPQEETIILDSVLPQDETIVLDSMFSCHTASQSNYVLPKEVTIVLPDNIPCSPDIFKIIVNFCYQRMEENEISITNVVKVIVASDFLEMKNLKSRATKFLDDIALTTWQGCLSVLSTFEANQMLSLHEHSQEDSHVPTSVAALSKSLFTKLFVKVMYVSFKKIEKFTCEGYFQSLSLMGVLQLAQFLPLDIAEIVYAYLVSEPSGLFYMGRDDTRISLCHFVVNSRSSFTNVYYRDRDGSIADMMMRVRTTLPDVSRRSLFILYMATLIIGRKECQVVVCLDFLCALLIEATEMVTKEENSIDLRESVENLPHYVGAYLQLIWSQEIPTLSSGQGDIEALLYKFDFSALLSVVKSIGILPDTERVLCAAKLFDSCLMAHLKDQSLAVHQVLEIYRAFPNDQRPSHVELYRVFEDCLSRKDLSRENLEDISKIFDYNKLTDQIVERLWIEFGFGWNGVGLGERVAKMRERVAKMHKAKKAEEMKIQKELVRLRTELGERDLKLKAISGGKEKVQNQLVVLTNELEKIARSKSQLECRLSDICSQLRVTVGDKMHAESNLRSELLRLRGQLMDMISDLETTGGLKTRVKKEVETSQGGG